MPTPVALDERKAIIDGQERYLFALGASGGCGGGIDDVIDPSLMLQELGNFFSVSENGEGLSIISPSRHLVAFLYDG